MIQTQTVKCRKNYGGRSNTLKSSTSHNPPKDKGETVTIPITWDDMIEKGLMLNVCLLFEDHQEVGNMLRKDKRVFEGCLIWSSPFSTQIGCQFSLVSKA